MDGYCLSNTQSPIIINSENTIQTCNTCSNNLEIMFNSHDLFLIENNGYYIELTPMNDHGIAMNYNFEAISTFPNIFAPVSNVNSDYCLSLHQLQYQIQVQ